MGRGGKGHRGRGGKNKGGRGGGGAGHRDDRDKPSNYDRIDKNNENFEKYYNTVLNLDDTERAEFWAALRRELPNSFRFAGSKGHALAVQKLLKERYIPEITTIEHYDGSKVEPPQPVPWYPDELAWSMTTPKNVVRRFPPFAKFQKFLVSETSVGNISRQEIVSMIPPLVLDVEPGMTVLDMCAAPGSKAAQLLEMIHKGEETRIQHVLEGTESDELKEDPSDDGRATGLLIANDADYKRSHLLIHQLKRLSSPNLIVTNHDATLFPSLKLPPTPENPSKNRYLKFDRILADVPCSGDGTCRKNPMVWKDWNGGNAIGLHTTQVRILVRALQMLKAGGRVVYSTCSMNPIENEAVIAAAIERCGGLEKVQLVDASDRLPLLKRSPGMKDWKVIDKKGNMWSSWAEIEEKVRGGDVAPARVAPTMFPPTTDLPLERCMRVYAHQQDTGGFFITVLQKMSEFRAKPEASSKIEVEVKEPEVTAEAEAEAEVEEVKEESTKRPLEDATEVPAKKAKTEVDVAMDDIPQTIPLDVEAEAPAEAETEVVAAPAEVEAAEAVEAPETEASAEAAAPAAAPATAPDAPQAKPQDSRKSKSQQFEEPFKYLDGSNPEVQSIESFYKLSPRFPRDRFLVRNAQGEPNKTIYYTSALARDIFTENEGKGIKFVHGGVRMFMKQFVQADDVCCWRIQSEGMPILQGYVGPERVVQLSKRDTLHKLLVEMFPKVSDDGWKNLGELGPQVRDIGMGCCVLRIQNSDDEDGIKERMVLPLWKSLHSLNLMLAKEDRAAMLLRLYNETAPLVNNRDPKIKAALEQNGEAASGSETPAEAADETMVEETTAEVVDETAAPAPEADAS